MKNLAAELLGLLRVVAFLTGAALAMGLLAALMNAAGEIAWTRPALGLTVLGVAAAVLLQRRRAAGATTRVEEDVVIDLTDDAHVPTPSSARADVLR